MNSSQLEACPFCEGKANLVKFWNSLYAVSCTRCRCSTAKCRSRQKAIDAWNRRPKKIYANQYYGQLFGTRLEKFRRKKQLSQKQLAALVNSSGRIINAVENGHFTEQINLLVSLADYFEISIDCLIRGNQPNPPNQKGASE